MSQDQHRHARVCPELNLFASAADAERVVEAWQRSLYRDGRFGIALFLLTATIGGAAAVFLVAVQRWMPLPAGPVGRAAIVFTIGPGVGLAIWYGVTRLWRQRFRRFVRAALRDRGIPVCQACGYDLRGLEALRCPECGWNDEGNASA